MIVACGDDDDASPIDSATPQPTPAASSDSPTATATPSPAGLEFSSSLALEHARVLAEDIGSRPAGSQAELSAAEYIRGQLESFGYEAELQPFPITTHLIIRSDVSAAHSGGTLDIEATPLTRSGSGLVTAEAVFADLGYPEDFPAETAGRIAILGRGELTFTEKIANALNAGAVAVIVFNNQGGPFGGTLLNDVPIPVLSISGGDGETLRRLIDEGALTLTIDVEIQASNSTSHNVIARPPGGECRILAGGHFDSVPTGPGANDNGSGTAVVIEIARTLAADSEFDDVCFALFGSEEIGLVGSFYYVNNEPLDNIETMLNFDMLAVGEGWPLGGTADIVNLAGEVAEELAIPYRISSDGTGGSDHAPFIDAGVPSLFFNCFCDPNYHTAADRFDFLSEERIGEAGALGIGLIELLLAQ